MDPVVDVVILSWFRVESTVRTVHSVLRQRGVLPQIWIVDQGSDGPTLAVLEELTRQFRAVHLTALGRNSGVPAGRNIAIGLGTAAVVVGLDNDATLDGDHVLRDTVACFDADPALGAVAFRILDPATGLDDRLSWVHPGSRSPTDPFPATRFCGAAHGLRRSAFEVSGGYDGALYFYWEESDLCRRMLERGYGVRYVPSLTAMHHKSPEVRAGWDNGRYYFCVRNRLYLEYCFGARPGWLVMLAAGYVVRGCRSGVGREALRGIPAAVLLVLGQRRLRSRTPLTPGTRAYLREHEGVHGRRARERLRAALTRLPEASRREVP